MATPLAPGMILRASVWCTIQNQASVNSFYYRVVAVGAPPATDKDFSDNFDSVVAADYKALLNAIATYKGVVAQIIWPPPIAADVTTTASAGAGTAPASAMALQTSGIISWYTAFAGRKQRGRTYVPFPSTSDNQATGAPSASYVTRLTALATASEALVSILSGGRTATILPVIWHRDTHTTDDIKVFFARGVWATQRRRGAYGRGNVSPI